MGDPTCRERCKVKWAKSSWPIVCCLALLAGLLLVACDQALVAYPSRPVPKKLLKDVEQMNAGRVLFRDKCVACHGKPSEGRSDRAVFFEPAAPDFGDEHYRTIDPAYLYWRIEVGKTVEPYRSRGSVMPAWGPYLSDGQIWQLVSYLQSRAH